MKSVQFSGSARTGVGKKDAKALRRDGLVPCVIYGGKEQVHVALQTKEIEKLFHSPEAFRCEIEVNGKVYPAIIKAAQWHPVSDELIHVDFLELVEDKKVTIQVPVRLEGNSIGVKNGGKLNLGRRKLTVRAFPKDLPDSLTLDITNLRIGQSIRIGDVATDNFELVNPDRLVIVAINRTRGSVDDEPEVEDEDEEGAEGEGGEAKTEEAAAE